MSFVNKPMAKKPATNPLPHRIIRLLRESSGLTLMGVALYLVLIFYGYDRNDAGWSHSGNGSMVHNFGGPVGAWMADLLLSLFGISSWWWVLFFLYLASWNFRRLDVSSIFDRRPLIVSAIAFVVLLASSSSFEALRLHSIKFLLPQNPGGMLGEISSNALSHSLGFTGATLLLMVLMAIGFSLFTGLSWIRFIEKLGGGLEGSFFFVKHLWHRSQDRRIGLASSIKRDELVIVSKKRFDEYPPLHIEPAAASIPQSQRIIKELQTPLFGDLPDSPLPPLHLLDEAAIDIEMPSPETLEFTSRLIEHKLNDFGVQIKVVAAYPGPVITRYEIEPAIGVKGSQVINLAKDLARALSVASIRVVETIPGKTTMGLEIPNPKRQVVRLLEILSSQVYADMSSPLTIALGKDIGGYPIVADLAKMPHVLVAGTTGSGKSVSINAMILSLLYKATPEKVRLILIDPKMLELSVYEGIPHLLAPVVTDMRQAASALRWCVAEMDRRYKLMSSLGVRNLAGYNQRVRDALKNGEPLNNPFSLTPDSPEPLEEMPLIVVVIDELADLMMVVGKKVEQLIARLAQKARAAGVHLLLATQRPSVDVITGLIKANIPTRIAFQVSSKIDSRTILDQMGAEALLGQGDMLYLPPGSSYPQRVHGAFVADHEVHRVVQYLKQHGEPRYVEGVLDSVEDEGDQTEGGALASSESSESDPLYDDAVALVLKSRRASISLVQRHLRIGYNRAARLIEEMERSGLVSTMQSNGNRDVLVPGRSDQ
ncbi:MAG: DNA translocase FtsK 4TM domain-containing protein [Nitrosomonadaceae bacterium]|nr:DNA translocase FtsK 4TM domain-containing protein [Nitrosospira sp.]MDW7565039.1 DNA translocase FtsK 4TM domain-containing protein [Nitrosomonadaceae bacterium]MBI0412451.1 DNA translocase FtsK 4TM domain-containing protein [Nitrosospira sp.]MDW7598214.1 DNA translocase FtsK 4TM domain-containing protein [Nitrosomonadaceae bacterium]MDW7618684.1 DNA translocase FtsK 4TM domain-containing protein [Nitrosomonadaceae bacterium]